MFGGGYVIPLKDVFEDIKRRLGALAVELPDVIDIIHATEIERIREQFQRDTFPSQTPSLLLSPQRGIENQPQELRSNHFLSHSQTYNNGAEHNSQHQLDLDSGYASKVPSPSDRPLRFIQAMKRQG